MSAPAVFLTRTPVRNVAQARAWSPGPSFPPKAFCWSSPEMTWIWSRSRAIGCIVRLSSNSFPSFFGHQNDWLTPLGT